MLDILTGTSQSVWAEKGVSHKFQNAFHIKWYNVNILIVLLLVMDWDCNMGGNVGNMIKKNIMDHWIIVHI